MILSRIAKHPVWWLIGAIMALFVALFIHTFAGTFVFGIFFYYISRPVYRRIHTIIPYRTISAALALIMVALPVLGLLGWLSLAALREYRIIESEIDIASQLNPYLEPVLDISSLTTESPSLTASLSTLQSTSDIVLQYLSFFGVGAMHLFLMIVIAFYLLRDDHKLKNWALQFDNNDHYLQTYIERVDKDLHHIFFGNILSALFAAIIAVTIYLAMNSFSPTQLEIPYPVLVGSLVGIGSLIPVVGMKIVYIPVASYLFAQAYFTSPSPDFWFPAFFFAVSFIFVDSVPDILLRPYVSGKETHIGLLMAAYILGPLMFGWYGVFLAPILLVLTLQFGKVILPKIALPEQTPTLEETLPKDNADQSEPTEENPTSEAVDKDVSDAISDTENSTTID